MRSTSCQRSSDSASGRRIDLPALLIEDVDAAEVAFHGGDQFVDRVELGQIAGVGLRFAACVDDAVDDVVEQVLSAGGHHDDVAPSRASLMALASPMPDDAPVIRMRLPRRSTG